MPPVREADEGRIDMAADVFADHQGGTVEDHDNSSNDDANDIPPVSHLTVVRMAHEDSDADEEGEAPNAGKNQGGRKRGRAMKNAVAGPSEDVEEAPAKRRGRPSKNAATRTSAPDASTANTSAIRRPGRIVAKKTEETAGPLRRSSRAAAGAANLQITGQAVKRPVQVKEPVQNKRSKRTGSAKKSTKREWAVEHIMGERRNKKTKETEYLVKWANYSDDDNTWEPSSTAAHSEIGECSGSSSLGQVILKLDGRGLEGFAGPIRCRCRWKSHESGDLLP